MTAREGGGRGGVPIHQSSRPQKIAGGEETRAPTDISHRLSAHPRRDVWTTRGRTGQY